MCGDCVEKIFDKLDVNDLAVAAQVCKLFQQVAQHIFFRKLNNRAIIAEDLLRGPKKIKLRKIENVLKSFGKGIRTLVASSIDGRTSDKANDKPILEIIAKYFGQIDIENVTDDAEEKNLKKLHLCEFHFDDSMVENVNVLFGRLTKLTLTKCKLLDGTDRLFANCVNLTKLKLDSVHTNPAVRFEYVGSRNKKFQKIITNDALDPCFNHSSPKLVSLTMRSIGTATGIDLGNFLSKNQQLRKLKIVNCGQFDGLLQSVAKYIPNIEKLSIQAKYMKKSADLLKLKQLKKLEINFYNKIFKNTFRTLGEMARSDISLDTLKLVDFQTTAQLIKNLSQFDTLKLKKLVLVVSHFPGENLQTLSESLHETEITVESIE